MKTNENDGLIEELLRRTFAQVPFLVNIEIEPHAAFNNSTADYRVKLGLPEETVTLLVEFSGNGEPRFIRQAISQLQEMMKKANGLPGMIVAPQLFDKSASLCREAGISYLDFSGNCWLSLKNIYIERSGDPKLRPERQILRSIYHPKAERILRVLLANPGKEWNTDSLAREANVSLGQVFKVKQHLLKLEWVSDIRNKLQLIAWRELLDDWKQNYSWQMSQFFHFYSRSNDADIERELAKVCDNGKFRYAFGLFTGAARLAPYTRTRQLFAYVDGDLNTVQDALDLKVVDSGANVTLLAPYDEGVFYGMSELDGLMICSPVQLYLDLNSYKGRGEEAAQFLFERIVEPQWSAE